MRKVNRPLLPTERFELRKWRPPFFVWRSRSRADQELAAGVAEEIDVEIVKAWGLNSCEEGCCERRYLLELGGGSYVWIASWVHLNGLETELPGRCLTMSRSPVSHHLLGVRWAGERIALHEPPGLSRKGIPGIWVSGECELLNDLSEEFRVYLGAA